MWLPDGVYKALPWIYLTMGFMFLAGVFYLDQRDFGSGVYFTTGLVTILGGLIVLYLRVKTRANRKNNDQSEGDTATG